MSERYSDEKRQSIALRVSAGILLVISLLGAAVFFLLRTPEQLESVIEEPVAEIVVARTTIERPVIRFSDITDESGIDFIHENGAQGERLLPETMGGGVALFDYDLDDDLDLLFINSVNWEQHRIEDSPVPRSRLYANDGSGVFSDVTDSTLDLSVYGMAPAIGDVNGDGYPDLFVTAVGKNRLLLNDRGKQFIESTDQYGVGGEPGAFSSCATFFDYDRDGDLDLFVCNYVAWTKELDRQIDFRLTGIGRAYGPPTDFPGAQSWLYRNDGDTFTEVSIASGIQVTSEQTGEAVGKGLAVSVIDVNADSWADLIVANDTVRNFLFINQADGTFMEKGTEYGIAFDPSGAATGAMGLDVTNYMNDDRLGIAIGNFANEMTSFYVSSTNMKIFSDDAIVVGIGAPTRKVLTFGLFFFDADLDGRQDFFSVNGHIEPEISSVQVSQSYEQKPQLFWNCGESCARPYVLIDDTESALDDAGVARGAVYGDIDNDGDLDIVLTNVGNKPRLLRNELDAGPSWLNVSLRYKPSNLYGIGSTVQLVTANSTQTRYITRTRSYLSQFNAAGHFGLGSDDKILSIKVNWPNGEVGVFKDVVANQQAILEYGKGLN